MPEQNKRYDNRYDDAHRVHVGELVNKREIDTLTIVILDFLLDLRIKRSCKFVLAERGQVRSTLKHKRR